MKIIKLIVSMIGILLLAYVGIGLALPSELNIKETISIKADQDAVFTQINDLKNWEFWSPWSKKDPGTVYEYSKNSAGSGAFVKWSSKHPDIGKGKLLIQKSFPPDSMEYTLFFADFQSTEKGGFALKATDSNTTEVLWWSHSEAGYNLILRYMYLAILEDVIRADFRLGLIELQKRVESED